VNRREGFWKRHPHLAIVASQVVETAARRAVNALVDAYRAEQRKDVPPEKVINELIDLWKAGKIG
jgi:galactose-1-phosphate uridylyltransferase